MTTPAQLIKDRGGAAAVAQALNLKRTTVQMWRVRNRIPRTAWPEIIEAFPDLTLEQLKAAEAA